MDNDNDFNHPDEAATLPPAPVAEDAAPVVDLGEAPEGEPLASEALAGEAPVSEAPMSEAPVSEAPVSEALVIETLAPDESDEPPVLESADELEETQAEIVDTELAQLLATPAGLRGAIEALLFASPDPLPLARISRALGVADAKVIAALLTQLRNDYDADRRGFQILETVAGYQMATREHFGDLILRLRHRKRRPALSPAALETLAIIAYRQPIIRAEIEAIRGVESGGTIRNLIDMNLVEMVGRKEVLGRPPMYGTTDIFLQAFGLRQLGELPPIGELKRRYIENEKARETAELDEQTRQRAAEGVATLETLARQAAEHDAAFQEAARKAAEPEDAPAEEILPEDYMEEEDQPAGSEPPASPEEAFAADEGVMSATADETTEPPEEDEMTPEYKTMTTLEEPAPGLEPAPDLAEEPLTYDPDGEAAFDGEEELLPPATVIDFVPRPPEDKGDEEDDDEDEDDEDLDDDDEDEDEDEDDEDDEDLDDDEDSDEDDEDEEDDEDDDEDDELDEDDDGDDGDDESDDDDDDETSDKGRKT